MNLSLLVLFAAVLSSREVRAIDCTTDLDCVNVHCAGKPCTTATCTNGFCRLPLCPPNLQCPPPGESFVYLVSMIRTRDFEFRAAGSMSLEMKDSI
ncbi:hypothetical protein GALMADRAFT_1247884 [Galerina marginata CBS 339.88]|uniref:Uncharacterized protein n=1 Tax=Galerina marginata (strain CBS 339.88) TaxID=685588 RepID=A0A067TIF5_GALM3|nr:hypothetical protein GALMADRAFT_1247884 [Galerina marginata CBS 339.88]